jgi:hypothetical protein
MGNTVFQPMKRLACLSTLLWLLSLAPRAGAVDEVFARVTEAEGEVRAGPGVSYRVIHHAVRGDAFLLEGRETTGYWLRIVLPDGRTGYILGDTVEVLAPGEGEEAPAGPGFFSPPALQSANGGMTLMAGVFDWAAYAELRPSFVLAPTLSIDPYIGMSLPSSGRTLHYGAGVTLNVIPDWAFAPYLHMGGGGYHFTPNEDAFVPRDKDMFHLRVGGGLLVSLRWRVLFRLEAMNTILFTTDFHQNAQSYTAGFGTYF